VHLGFVESFWGFDIKTYRLKTRIHFKQNRF
jgi:hypothetical protein